MSEPMEGTYRDGQFVTDEEYFERNNMEQCQINDCDSNLEAAYLRVTFYDGWQVTLMCPVCAEELDVEYGVMSLRGISEFKRFVPKPTTP